MLLQALREWSNKSILENNSLSFAVTCFQVLSRQLQSNIGGIYMSICLRALTTSNWFQCTQLEVTDEQKQLFPAPVVYWIAESKFVKDYEPLAIYDDEELVGFIVYCNTPDHDGNYWIPALMIDAKFQRKGYARAAMIELINYMRTNYGCDRLMIGHRPNNIAAGRLYNSLGFMKVSEELVDGEVVRLLQ